MAFLILFSVPALERVRVEVGGSIPISVNSDPRPFEKQARKLGGDGGELEAKMGFLSSPVKEGRQPNEPRLREEVEAVSTSQNPAATSPLPGHDQESS
jgi:hypothetical protein